MSQFERQLDVILEGPAAAGRLSVDYLAVLAKELQSTLRRIAHNQPVSTGRFGKEIEQACKLDLVGFDQGSVHLRFELAEAPENLLGHLGEESLRKFVSVLEQGGSGASDWSAGLPPRVLDGIERITRPLADGITSIRFETYGARAQRVELNPTFRTMFQRDSTAASAPGFLEVIGVIWEANWKDHTAELHTADGQVIQVSFDSDLEEDITEARKCRVRASGTGKKLGERVQSLNLSQLEILEAVSDLQPASVSGFWEMPTIAQLAEQQEAQPHTLIDDLAGDWPENESLDDFLGMVRRGRA